MLWVMGSGMGGGRVALLRSTPLGTGAAGVGGEVSWDGYRAWGWWRGGPCPWEWVGEAPWAAMGVWGAWVWWGLGSPKYCTTSCHRSISPPRTRLPSRPCRRNSGQCLVKNERVTCISSQG